MVDLALQPRIIELEAYLPRLRAYLRRPEISLAYLYGSYAKGRPWLHSDVDIAVLLTEEIEEREYFDYRLRYIGGIAHLLHFDDVDVQVLNGASVEFQYQVIAGGRILFVQQEAIRVRFETQVMLAYFDLKPILDEYYRHLFRRIKEGKFSARLPGYIAQAKAAAGRSRSVGRLSGTQS